MTITDESGDEIASFTAVKTFGTVIYSSTEVSTGSTYVVTVDGTATTVTAGEGAANQMGGGAGGGQPGGGMGAPPDQR